MLNLIPFTAGVFVLCAPSAPRVNDCDLPLCGEDRSLLLRQIIVGTRRRFAPDGCFLDLNCLF